MSPVYLCVCVQTFVLVGALLPERLTRRSHGYTRKCHSVWPLASYGSQSDPYASAVRLQGQSLGVLVLVTWNNLISPDMLVIFVCFSLSHSSLLQLLVVMDGSERFGYDMTMPPLPEGGVPSYPHQYLIAGGGVSEHILERHITLVRAQTNKISWKLSFLSILNGES